MEDGIEFKENISFFDITALREADAGEESILRRKNMHVLLRPHNACSRDFFIHRQKQCRGGYQWNGKKCSRKNEAAHTTKARLYGCGKCRHGNRLQAAASWTTESFWRLR